jgi:predicted AlkP superfamily pyrophosphatase or phosphodiesterase
MAKNVKSLKSSLLVIIFLIWSSFVATATAVAVPTASAATALGKPNLIVVLVFDQFRADYLTRFESRFLPAQKNGQIGGFRYLMERGSYYPFAQHDVLQNMTCPGHAAILSGAHPYQHGIPTNDWLDRKNNKMVYCVDDREYEVIGAKKSAGISPKNLMGTTFGDELKNAGLKSRVFTVALKDRAAVLLGGHRADLALWFDIENFEWVTSKYYVPEGQLPDWLMGYNQKLNTEKNRVLNWHRSSQQADHTAPKGGISVLTKEVQDSIKAEFPHEGKASTSATLLLPFGVEKTIDLAEFIIQQKKMGRGPDPDVLAISFSTHDNLGHQFGPNSPEMEEMTIVEDANVSRLLQFLDKNVPGGLKKTLVVMTGDHGVSPTPEYLQETRIPSGRLDEKKLKSDIETFLGTKYKLSMGRNWISEVKELNVYLNKNAISEAKVSLAAVQSSVVEFIKESYWMDSLAYVFQESDVRAHTLPPGVHEAQILKTYFPGRSGDVIMIQRPFYIIGNSGANHLTGYSYDRTVPMLFLGANFKSNRFSQAAHVVDIATTLAFLTGVIPPSGAEGRVLTEALK